jgi:hypothetical protein
VSLLDPETPRPRVEQPPALKHKLRQQFGKTYRARRHPCVEGRHLVAREALVRPGRYPCLDCGMPVHVDVPLSEL